MKRSLLFLVTFFLSTHLFASESLYMGIDYSAAEYKEDKVKALNLSIVQAKFGKRISQHLSVEAVVSKITSVDNLNLNNSTIEIELDGYSYGARAVVHLPATDRLSLYGSLGVVNTELDATIETNTGPSKSNMSDSGLSYGAGANYIVNNHIDVNVGYDVQFDSSNKTVSGLSVGVTYFF